jgi:hypothetical protein
VRREHAPQARRPATEPLQLAEAAALVAGEDADLEALDRQFVVAHRVEVGRELPVEEGRDEALRFQLAKREVLLAVAAHRIEEGHRATAEGQHALAAGHADQHGAGHVLLGGLRIDFGHHHAADPEPVAVLLDLGRGPGIEEAAGRRRETATRPDVVDERVRRIVEVDPEQPLLARIEAQGVERHQARGAGAVQACVEMGAVACVCHGLPAGNRGDPTGAAMASG